MSPYKINQITFELREGDIANQPDIAAVVNAANAEPHTEVKKVFWASMLV